ncbi:MAG: hypothetical protein KKB39_06005 [Nanoarchaeota archaeon]|nr:hypothetical protein [Nanoarchaeota archaeon]
MKELIERVKEFESFLKDKKEKARWKSIDYIHYSEHKFIHTEPWIKVEQYEKCLNKLYELCPELRGEK